MAAAVLLTLVTPAIGGVAGPDPTCRKVKLAFSQIFSKTREINWLSAARFFLFGARDVWFVVGVPVFLAVHLGWSFTGGRDVSWLYG